MTTTRKQLGNMIRTAREDKGLTVRDAANRIGIDYSYYGKIENGHNALGKHARAVARVLGLNADELEALASAKLPTFAPYLRAKYDLPAEAVAELEKHFETVSQQYKGRKRGRS